MNKRYLTGVFALWFAVSASLYPSRQANAMLLPLIIGLVTITALGVASYCEVAGCFTPISPESVASAVGASGVQRIEARLSTGEKVRIPTVADGAPAPDVDAVVAAQLSCSDGYTLSGGMCKLGAVYNPLTDYPAVASCPAGYVASGSNCALTDARLVEEDGSYDLKRDGDGFSVQPEADSKPVNVDINNGQGVIYGQDSQGRPTIHTFSSDGSGGTRVVTQTQINSGGQSYVQTDTVSVSGGGVVTGVSSTTQTGTISAGADGGVGTVTTGGDAEKVAFPSDYARTGEAAAAADGIKDKLDVLHEDLTGNADGVVDPLAPDESEFRGSFFANTFDSLLGWTVPAHTSVCPTSQIDFDFFGRAFHLSFDAHCTILSDSTVSEVAAVSFNVLWLVAALFIVLGA